MASQSRQGRGGVAGARAAGEWALPGGSRGRKGTVCSSGWKGASRRRSPVGAAAAVAGVTVPLSRLRGGNSARPQSCTCTQRLTGRSPASSPALGCSHWIRAFNFPLTRAVGGGSVACWQIISKFAETSSWQAQSLSYVFGAILTARSHAFRGRCQTERELWSAEDTVCSTSCS